MNTKNTKYSLSNRVSKEKRQYKNRCPNQKKKQSYLKRKKIFLNELTLKQVKK